MDFLRKIAFFLNRVFLFVAAVSLVLMMLIGFSNVLLRTVWHPLEGTYELIGFLGALTTALALGFAQLRKNHIAVDIITAHYSQRWQKISHGISYLVTSVFFAIVARQTTIWGNIIWHSGECSETLGMIYFPFIYVVALGFAFLAFILLLDFIQLFLKKKSLEENL
jgi:TRAP-type C4-dicarboxylate transport system permease small subunit